MLKSTFLTVMLMLSGAAFAGNDSATDAGTSETNMPPAVWTEIELNDENGRMIVGHRAAVLDGGLAPSQLKQGNSSVITNIEPELLDDGRIKASVSVTLLEYAEDGSTVVGKEGYNFVESFNDGKTIFKKIGTHDLEFTMSRI